MEVLQSLQRMACLIVCFSHVESGFTANANSVLCVHCGMWLHGGCAGVRRTTVKSTLLHTFSYCSTISPIFLSYSFCMEVRHDARNKAIFEFSKVREILSESNLWSTTQR